MLSKVPKERRKAAIKEMIELSFRKGEEDSTDSIVWLRHAVKGLYEEVFGESFDNDKATEVKANE